MPATRVASSCVTWASDFPIADAAAFLDDARPLADMPLVRLPDPLFVSVGDTRLALEAQERLAALPFPMNPGIDRFVADLAEVAGALDVPGDLLGREPGAQ